MSQSLWSDSQRLPAFKILKGNIKTDVLIIGGGLCGILCAYLLQEAGVDCLLAEADTIGSGITCNTTAKLTSQHGLIYDQLYRTRGKEMAELYLDANETALSK